ncbi:MAG: malate dehydrogenase [Candidatus Omnitrophota bacterium]
MKVSVIGAGNVGGTLTQRLAESGLCEVVLLDILEGIPEGKAFDLHDCRGVLGFDSQVQGTHNYQDIAGSDVVVVTAGLARQPGMTREDLLKKNTSIIEQIVKNIVKFTPDCILIMVTNPLDVLTNIAFKISGFDAKRVMGMGGVLDSARFANLIAEELNVPVSSIEALVIGAHGQAMLPLARLSRVKGEPLSKFLSLIEQNKLVEKTINRGAEIVKRLGKGSAYYAPSAAAFTMIKSIICDEKKVMPACVYLSGEYNIKGVCIGVPVRLGKQGAEEIINLDLTHDEQTKLLDCAQSIKKQINSISK